MSESGLYDPKFDFGTTYTRDEFIFKLEIVLSILSPSEVDAAHFATSNIAWAKAHPPETMISFNQSSNGTVYPVATIQAILPLKPID